MCTSGQVWPRRYPLTTQQQTPAPFFWPWPKRLRSSPINLPTQFRSMLHPIHPLSRRPSRPLTVTCVPPIVPDPSLHPALSALASCLLPNAAPYSDQQFQAPALVCATFFFCLGQINLPIIKAGPPLRAKSAKNRESGAKWTMILACFSYLRAPPKKGAVPLRSFPLPPTTAAVGRARRRSAPLDDSRLDAVASVTASQVAYCDARNRLLA